MRTRREGRGRRPGRVPVRAGAAALLALAGAARAQLETRFEPPPYVGSAAGTVITAQDGWGTPVGFLAYRVFTYAGNAPALPNSAAGLTQFTAGTVAAGQHARATHAVNFGISDVWTATWDVAGEFVGVLPTSPVLGRFSLEDAATQRFWEADYQWVNPVTATSLDALYTVFSSGGAQLAPMAPGPQWQGLQPSHWYRQSTTWQQSSNQVTEVTITDLTTGATAVVNPVGWFLHGGAAPSRPPATGVSLNTTGADGNVLAWDNLAVAPQVQIASVNPPFGGNGDVIQITGIGFGTNPSDVAVFIADGQRAHPMTVLAVTPNQIQARVEPLPADANPGPVVVTRGIGLRGVMAPQLRDIIPEDPQGVWVHRRLADPRVATSGSLFNPVFHPPPTGTSWFFSKVVSGKIEVSVSGNRLPNSTLTLQARMANAPQRVGTALAETSIRLRLGGDALHTANRVAEALRAGLARDGVLVNSVITADGVNQWKITVEQRDPLNVPLAIDQGEVDIAVANPILVNPFPIGPVTAFYQAGLLNLGAQAQVTGVDASGNDGATITPNVPVVGGLRCTTDPIPLGPTGSSFTVTGWGTVNATPDQFIGTAKLLNIGAALRLTGDFTSLGAASVTVQVFNNTLQTATATVPAGTLAQIVSAGSGLPQVVGCGHLLVGGAGLWIDLDRLVQVTPTGGSPVLGNQLRVRPSGGTAVVQNVQAYDLAAGLTGMDGGGNFNINGMVQGGVCYANCDGSTSSPALNVADFTCFLQRYALGDVAANCDGSTNPPTLNVSDFTCFLQNYANGCP